MGKPLVGSRKYAEDALALYLGYPLRSSFGADWHIFSEGSIRTVWLHKPTNVVYKVDGSYREEDYDNAAELRNARRLMRRKFERVYIPKTTGFHIRGNLVLAMEYMGSDLAKFAARTDHREAREELLRKCRFSDMHGANFAFVVMDGIVKAAPVDMGSRIVPKNDPYDVPDDRCLTCGDNDVWGDYRFR